MIAQPVRVRAIGAQHHPSPMATLSVYRPPGYNRLHHATIWHTTYYEQFDDMRHGNVLMGNVVPNVGVHADGNQVKMQTYYEFMEQC